MYVGLSGSVLDCFMINLSESGGLSSANSSITCGVPEGSVLGPVLEFISVTTGKYHQRTRD